MLSVVCATSGLVLPSAVAPAPVSRAAARMACIEEFSISREIKSVRIFDGAYDQNVCDEVTAAAVACIEEKGSFSLCIPGGSVVKALENLKPDAADWSKMHVFLCNEKVPSLPCISGALEQTAKIGVPDANVHGFGEGEPKELAAKYSELLSSHPSIDNSGGVPAMDMMLLGTGPDGHCGCLFPDTPEIKATGTGQIVMAGNDARADGDFLAVSMDVMCATKLVIVSAADEGRAEMVAKALSGEFGAFDCPAGMVEAAGETIWFTNEGGISKFDEEIEDEEEDGDSD
jgi:6-phosphogluconolactonase